MSLEDTNETGKNFKEFFIPQTTTELSEVEIHKHIDTPAFDIPAGEIDDGDNVEIYTQNKKGEKDGPAVKTWSVKGSARAIIAKTFYKHDVEEGPFKVYIFGHLSTEGIHKNGKLDGMLKKHHPNGQVDVFEYKDGEEIKK